MSLGRRILFSAAAFVLSIFVAVMIVEAVLRYFGDQPWRFVGNDPRIPIVFEADPVLGWRPKPGEYFMPAYDWSGPPRLVIRPDRTRDTGAPLNQSPELVFIGCSFTFGWGIADDETFAARLQQKHPDWRVMNLGVPAYSGYQALLRLEQLFANGVKPKRVLYGYMQGHELRNIAHPAWTYLIEKYSTQGMVAVPYVTIDDQNNLVRHSPEHYPAWPLRGVLAMIPRFELAWAVYARQDRIDKSTEIADQVVLEMARLCRAHGVEFGVVLLQADPEWKDHYARLLGARDLRLIDCDIRPTPDMLVPIDGHPNARAHEIYANCIEKSLTAPPRS
jgi:hypothetical protein